jgi:hypothetical protein
VDPEVGSYRLTPGGLAMNKKAQSHAPDKLITSLARKFKELMVLYEINQPKVLSLLIPQNC